jgi:hypothetical protein
MGHFLMENPLHRLKSYFSGWNLTKNSKKKKTLDDEGHFQVISALGTILKPMSHKHWGFEVAGRTHHDNVFLDLDTPNIDFYCLVPNHPNRADIFFHSGFQPDIFSFEVEWARDNWGPLLYNVPIELHSRIQHFLALQNSEVAQELLWKICQKGKWGTPV